MCECTGATLFFHWSNYRIYYLDFLLALRSRLWWWRLRLRLRPKIKKNSTYFFPTSIFDFEGFKSSIFDKNGIEKLSRGICTWQNKKSFIYLVRSLSRFLTKIPAPAKYGGSTASSFGSTMLSTFIIQTNKFPFKSTKGSTDSTVKT